MSTYEIITFDVSILSDYYTAKSNLYNSSASTALTAAERAALSSADAEVEETPWDEAVSTAGFSDDEAMAELYKRYNEIRDKTTFIDEGTDDVELAEGRADEKTLFTLYSALRDLETIAEYASYEYTPEALLKNLNEQFQNGLEEIKDYIADAEVDDLTLIFGSKSPYVASEVTLGRNSKVITGSTLNVIDDETVMNDLTGTETFTIHLESGLNSDDVTVDLANITGDINLKNIVSEINRQISSITKVNSEGETVSTYSSRAEVIEDSNEDFSINFNIKNGEGFTFTAAVSEPTIVVVGGKAENGTDDITTGTLTKYDELSTGSRKMFTQTVAGEEDSLTAVETKDDDGNVIAADANLLETSADGVATDSQGNIYVVGSSQGSFGSQINTAETDDVFLSKYNASGEIVWQKLLGASDSAQAFDVVVDNDDNIIIAGQIDGSLGNEGTTFDDKDSFVTKYDLTGEEQWTYQLDTTATDQANALATDSDGNVYVTGQIKGSISTSLVGQGGSDSFVLKLNAESGGLESSALFGGATEDYGEAITVSADGNIIVASREGGDAIIRTLDSSDLSTVLSTLNVGDLGGGEISDLATDGNQVYLVGSSDNGSLAGGGSVVSSYQGGRDGFVTRIDTTSGALSSDWTSFIGTSSAENISGVTVENGSIYLAGTTYGDLSGANQDGISDAFAVKLDAATGAEEWNTQLGEEDHYATGSAIAFSSNGSSILTKLGLPTGEVNTRETRDIETQSSARVGDYFYVSIDGGADRKITLEEGDTFESLAKRINRLSYNQLEATATLTSANGQGLKIESLIGTIEVTAGEAGQDLLAKLGMEETKLLPSDVLYSSSENIGTDPLNLGGIFALNLSEDFGLSTKKESEYVMNQVSTAISAVKRAFSSLTYDPVKAQVLADSKNKYSGTVPAYLTAQLANYQSGLEKLLSVTGGTSTLV